MADGNPEVEALGTAPIRADAPAGESARYEPEFERIEAEVAKLESLSRADVDWKAVVRDATAILAGKSKDLLVAAYLCRGLFDTQGYPGLATGLTVLRDMVQTFWEPLFPPRPRARAAAAVWLAEKVGAAVAAQPPVSSDREVVAAALGLTEAVEGLLAEHLGDDAPGLGDVRRALKEHADRLTRPAPEAPKAAPAAKAAAAPAAAPEVPAAIESDTDFQKVLKAWQETARTMAAYLRERDPADPRPYVMLRAAAWMGVDALPPADAGGMTQLRGINEEQAKAYALLLEKAQHAELLEQTEGSLVRMPFWLDAHRLAAAALDALGHTEARDGVAGMVATYVRRFPKLMELQFAGGRPFADERTRLWLETEVLATPEGADGPAGAGAGEAEAPWVAATAEAKAAAAGKGGVEAGLMRFQEGYQQAFSLRERFLWELARARFCKDLGQVPLAVAQLEALDDQVARYDLEAWEPELAVEVAKLLSLCYKGQPKAKEQGPERAARLERLRARLCRFDVRAALALDGK